MILEQLGIALGLASLAGLNLYLTTFVVGLAVRFDWIHLASKYESMDVLGHPWVLGVSGGLMLIEFFADKVPWLDSAWDAVHSLIRPAGGIFLGLAAMGNLDPVATVIAGLLAGTAALSTHGTKSGVRAFLNLSPEPVSNTTASVAEDGMVLGGLGLIALAPAVAFFVFLLVVIFCAAAAIWLWRRAANIWLRRKQIAQHS